VSPCTAQAACSLDWLISPDRLVCEPAFIDRARLTNVDQKC
jgi:hypothetical protein